MVELGEGRYYFRGRKGGIINVGGLKVYPEEVESVLNADPRVRMSRVLARRNPITGAVVVAEVVLVGARDADAGTRGRREERLAECLPPHARRTQGTGAAALRPGARADGSRQTGASVMRNVIVTGGSRGLGLAMARTLAAAGYRVIAVARTAGDELTAAASQAAAEQPRRD